MRKLLITLDEDLDLWLANELNQNETVRKALKLYKEDISTPDTIAGLRQSYSNLHKYMDAKFQEQDVYFQRLDKLLSMLETRM
jgi:hypothetical protein